MGVEVMVSTGGTSLRDDIIRLNATVHIVVGTPGRVLDLTEKGVCKLGRAHTLVMDEVRRRVGGALWGAQPAGLARKGSCMPGHAVGCEIVSGGAKQGAAGCRVCKHSEAQGREAACGSWLSAQPTVKCTCSTVSWCINKEEPRAAQQLGTGACAQSLVIVLQADKLLSPEFQPVIEQLISFLQPNRQICLYSATFPVRRHRALEALGFDKTAGPIPTAQFCFRYFLAERLIFVGSPGNSWRDCNSPVLRRVYPDVRGFLLTSPLPHSAQVTVKEFKDKFLRKPYIINLMEELTLKGITQVWLRGLMERDGRVG